MPRFSLVKIFDDVLAFSRMFTVPVVMPAPIAEGASGSASLPSSVSAPFSGRAVITRTYFALT